MTKYTVPFTWSENVCDSIEVEADNEEEAIDKAGRQLDQDVTRESRFLDTDRWISYKIDQLGVKSDEEDV